MAQPIISLKPRHDYNAPRVNLASGEFTGKKLFVAGVPVRGWIHTNNDKRLNIDKLFVTEDNKYAMPLSVMDLPKEDLLKAAETTDSRIPMTFSKEIRTRLNAIKSTDVVDNVIKTSKSSANGLLIGAGAGLAFAIVYKKHLVGCVLIGALLGGYGAYSFTQNGIATNLKNFDK